MWGIRSPPSSTLFLCRVARLQSLTSKSLAGSQPYLFRAFSSDTDKGDFLTGKVKFYLRDKAYGFIVPDGDASQEIWVHRTSLDTPHSPEKFPTRPYLLRDERVKFRVERAAGKSDKAADVLFENGRQVPLFRKNYHASVVRGEMHRLGETVFEILKDEDLSDDERMEQIKLAGKTAEENVSVAAERQQEFGPEPDTDIKPTPSS